MMAKTSKANGFESKLEQLDEIVTNMEDGELSLEESLKAFEKGIKLTRECQTALQKAEQKVQLLTEENDIIYSQELDDLEE